jgi:hypothetical protein
MSNPLLKPQFSGTCDWCHSQASDLIEHRDFEEGANGPIYDVCSTCRKKEAKRVAEELSGYGYE